MKPRVTAPNVPGIKTEPSQPNGPAQTQPVLPEARPVAAEQVAAPDRSVNPFAPDEGRQVTKAEYWDMWYANPYTDVDVSYEWINGVLEAKPLSTPPQSRLFRWFFLIMDCYVERIPGMEMIFLDTGFTVRVLDPDVPGGVREQVYKPDFGVILPGNPARMAESERSYSGTFDFTLESLSDSKRSEVRRDTEQKKRDYALAGVKEYYILDPSGEHMHFYRLATEGRYEEVQPDAEGMIRSTVLPGFQFRLRDLERMPSLEELALDEGYAGYVLLRYQASAAAVSAAEERAAAAEERAQALQAELERLRQQRS